MSFGEEVKRLRESHEMTQGQLAEKIGMTQGQVSHLETGRRGIEMTASTLYRLCDALGVKCDHFRGFISPAPIEETPAVKPKKKPRGK